jgi:hypothetical protein
VQEPKSFLGPFCQRGKEGIFMGRTAFNVKTKVIAGVFVLVAATTGVLAWVSQPNEQPKVASSQTSVQKPAASSAVVRADYVSYPGQDGKNALELLKSHTKVQTKSSSFGDMVVAINGKDGANKKYWTFYINGEMAQVGAGAYTTKNADKIEWKLQ